MSEHTRHLTRENFESMEANVKRGAAYFDLTYPGWWRKKDPDWWVDSFRMIDGDDDIYAVVGMDNSVDPDPKFGNWAFTDKQAEGYESIEIDLGFVYLQHLWLKEVLIRWSSSAKEYLGDTS